MLISLVKLVKKIILGFDKSLQMLMQISIIVSTVKGLKLYFLINSFKPNGFFHSYHLEKSILEVRFRGVRLLFSSLA